LKSDLHTNNEDAFADDEDDFDDDYEDDFEDDLDEDIGLQGDDLDDGDLAESDFDDDDFDDDDFDDGDPLAAQADIDEDLDVYDDDESDDEEAAALEPEEKEALLAEIRDAMGAMSHIKPDEEKASEKRDVATRHGSWAEDEEFGRQAIARKALDRFDDTDVGDRLLEETNSKFSDGEGSRRRLAIAHMKAAAAATKADRVLKRHTGRDPSNDPEEQHQYREDLAKVMRPHEPEMEHEENPMDTPQDPRRPSTPREHAAHRVLEDPSRSLDWREAAEDEDLNAIRTEVGGMNRDAMNRSDRPISEGRKRIWDIDEDAPSDVAPEPVRVASRPEPTPEPVFEPTPEPEPEQAVIETRPEPVAAVAPPTRRPGRVKTRIIGFQADEDGEKDIFGSANKQESHATKFPTGWIVVTGGPGRGSAFTLFNGVSKIGRGEEQSVTLDFGDNSISRDNHAAIAYDAEARKFFLGHGGKSNIVRLNDKPVLSTEEIMDGDTIRIGETTLTFVSFCGEDFSWETQGEGGADHAAIA
ncbi:MAG: FHA domain-containing protein, partial [Pseudomonadota bacterium]